MRTGLALLAVCAMVATTSASSGRSEDVGTRAKGSERVVVAVVEDVVSRFDVNEFGDRLILSQVWVRVDETLKGTPAAVLPIEVEGGTVGDLTLSVSDMPAVRKGDRAVFFLESAKYGSNRPHHRGDGVLKLDAAGRGKDSNLTLSDVRAAVRAAQR